MRTTTLVAAVLAGAGLRDPARAAAEDEAFPHGYVRHVEAGVTLHRATEVSAEEALVNLPFLPGDRVWSDASGRAEFRFPEGTLVRLDSRSKLDYSGHEEGRGERIVLRLWSGSLIVRARTQDGARFEVETPAGTVELLEAAMVRLDVEAGEARLSVYRGAAVLDDGRARVRVEAGERTFARWGEPAAAPTPFDALDDDFARWDDAREADERLAARSSEYLPAELDPYAGELARSGSWRFEASVGYVWAPRVAVGWSPYTNGHWSWTPYGWTWVPYETWGWAPFHYGRWGFSASFGWYWAPGRTWGPGWVSWGVGGGYVGWCPLGWRDRPVYPWHGSFNRGHAVPRRGGRGGWSVVREGDFGGRDVARRRVPLAGIDPGALRVADSPSLRPSRDGRSLLASNQAGRAISRRPTPGDFVRELAVDNKTTIPSPWLRRGRDGATQRVEREGRERAGGARDGSAEGAFTRGGSVTSRGSESAATQSSGERADSRRASRYVVPWYTPRAERGAPRADAEARTRRAPEARGAEAGRRDLGARMRSAMPSFGGAARGEARSDAPAERGRSEPRAGARSYRPQAERETGGGPARYRSAPERRDESRSYRPQPQSAPAPPRSEPRAGSGASRRESSGSSSSRGDSGARVGGGRGGRVARPPRD
jgi:hypothetical protein